MRLSDALASQVTSSTRARGLDYFTRKKVLSLEQHDGIIQATVAGTDDYDVWIESGGPRLRVSCTCPHCIDHLQVCKHIWATMLAAEVKGLPLLPPGPAPSRIRFDVVADP